MSYGRQLASPDPAPPPPRLAADEAPLFWPLFTGGGGSSPPVPDVKDVQLGKGGKIISGLLSAASWHHGEPTSPPHTPSGTNVL